MVVYLLTALHVTSPNLRSALVSILLALAVASCAIGAIQFSEGKDFMPFNELPRTPYGTRISGFLASPNHLAGFLEVTSLLGFAITCWSRWRIWAKVLMGYASLICLAGIAFTGSRGGYASTAVGILVFGVLSLLIVARQKSDRFGYVLATVVFAALFVACVAYVAVSRMPDFNSRLKSATTLDDARMRIWPSAVNQFQLNPVFGTGSGTFLYYGREYRDRLIQTDPRYAHNDFLQVLAEYGIIGLVGVLSFLAIHLICGWKALARSIELHNEFEGVGDTSMALTVGALSGVAAIIVHSAVDFNFHIPSNTLLAAFVLGILANPGGTLRRGRGESVVIEPRIGRLALPALGLWMVVAGFTKLPGAYLAWKAGNALGDWTTLDSGQYAVRAEEFARRGLRWDSTSPNLLNCLGDALFARAELSPNTAEREDLLRQSIDAYQRAIKSAPRDRDLFLGLGWSLDAMRRFDEADSVFARAVALDPNSGYVRWASAAHLEKRGKLVEAEAEYQKSVPLGGGPNADNGLRRVTEKLKMAVPDSGPAVQPSSL